MLSWLYRSLVRPVLFSQDPEFVHNITVKGLQGVSSLGLLSKVMHGVCSSPELPVSLLGLKFPNPIGLAAGMDKAGVAMRAWEAMGFGFSELGAVTWYAQPGNPSPRVFRAVPAEAIVNRMGFNNDGAAAMADRLKRYRDKGCWPSHPVGINLGKSKITELIDAPLDYLRSFTLLRELGDFFVINVSSPNTPNLRKLQDKESLKAIFSRLQAFNNKRGRSPKPILLKIAPDLSDEALEDIVDMIPKLEIAGIVATNTTITRPETENQKVKKVYAQQGGLSGKPLKVRSTEVIEFFYRKTRGMVPIIGVGGIFTAEDAWEKITHGASLLQIFTSLVYGGPLKVKEINMGLKRLMEENGFKMLHEAVGSAIKK